MRKTLLTFIGFFMVLSGYAQFGFAKYKVVTDSVYSEKLGAWRAYNVCLPPGFDQNEEFYPVLYLLHGMSDDHRCWVEKGKVQEVADRFVASGEMVPMVIVTPCAGGLDVNNVWNGYFDMPDWPYEAFFFDEFLPYIEKTYRCGGAKSKRAVAGLSMGGGGCTSYGQRHADLFCGVYAMSAFLHSEAPKREPRGKVDWLMKSAHDQSCLLFVQQADEARKAALRSVRWYVDCGDDDFLLEGNMDFYKAMRRAGIPCQLRVRDGGHDWEYWHTALYDCLPFVSRCFRF